MKHVLTPLLATAILGLAACAPAKEAQAPRIPDAVKATIRTLVDEGYAPGIVVGVVNPRGTAFFSYGERRAPLVGTLDENSVFNVGGITKTFAGVLLADMVERGEVQLDDPVQMYLPEGIRAPTRNGQSITLRHLATHTSGLPSYAPRSIEGLYRYLSAHTLRRDIGADYEYTSPGIRLLGAILARRAGMTFEELFVQRIANELEMSDSRVTITPSMKSRLSAESPNTDGIRRGAERPWYQVHSNARDLLEYLAANVGSRVSRLSSAMEMAHEARVEASRWRAVPIHLRQGSSVGLAWHISDTGNRKIIWHIGGSSISSAFVGIDVDGQTGAVVLMNHQGTILDLGFQLLDPATSIEVDAATLAGDTGWYEFSNGDAVHVSVQGGQLTVQPPQSRWFPVYAESETDFFEWITGPFSFMQNEQGDVTGLVLEGGGREQTAQRMGPNRSEAFSHFLDGREQLRQHRIPEAITAFAEAEARDPTLTIPDEAWSDLCWDGSVWGHAAEVMSVCDHLVALDPDNGRWHGDRGMARTLTGDFVGAIEDFEAFIAWLHNDDDLRAEVQEYLDALRAGRNPLTPEVLARLKR